MEGHVATVGHVYLAYLHGIVGLAHLYLVATVDDEPQPRTVYFHVVAHVAKFLDLVGIAFGIDVTQIVYGAAVLSGKVEVVEGTLVRAHVAFAEHVHAYRLSLLGTDTGVVVFHIDDGVVGTAARQQQDGQQAAGR